MSIIFKTFSDMGLSLQRETFTYLNEALSHCAEAEKAEYLDQITQEILNSNANTTLSISRAMAEDALLRISNQSKREFDGADLTVLDIFKINAPLFHTATNTFLIYIISHLQFLPFSTGFDRQVLATQKT